MLRISSSPSISSDNIYCLCPLFLLSACLTLSNVFCTVGQSENYSQWYWLPPKCVWENLVLTLYAIKKTLQSSFVINILIVVSICDEQLIAFKIKIKKICNHKCHDYRQVTPQVSKFRINDRESVYRWQCTYGWTTSGSTEPDTMEIHVSKKNSMSVM